MGQDRRLCGENTGGDEVVHNIDFGGKAKVWVWQFAIFAVGTLPAVGMTVLTVKRYGGPGAAG